MAIAMRAVCFYRVPDGGPHGETEAVLGKVLETLDGKRRVFSRREPAWKAKLRIRNAYSIDARAPRRWPHDDIAVVQFIYGDSGDMDAPSLLITPELWEAHQDPGAYGAGLQEYVGEHFFEHHDRVIFADADYTTVPVDLEPLPRTRWDNLPAPQAPQTRLPRGVLPGQVGLL